MAPETPMMPSASGLWVRRISCTMLSPSMPGML